MSVTQETKLAVSIDPTAGFRRVASAIALPVAFFLQLIANTTYAIAFTESGITSTESAVDALRMTAEYPGQAVFATVLALIGCLLAVVGVPAVLRVLRPAKPRLGLWAVLLMVAGYVCYFGLNFGTFEQLGLALYDLEPAGAAIDATPARGWFIVFALVFVIGNLGGTLLLGLAVLLGARRMPAIGVPWWAGLLIMGWTVGHLINIFGGGEWFAVAGGALEVIGLGFVTRALLQMPNSEWIRRG